ncbi:MAG: hypothetical protein Tsb006_1690 [Rickettsiaceae bacterium]
MSCNIGLSPRPSLGTKEKESNGFEMKIIKLANNICMKVKITIARDLAFAVNFAVNTYRELTKPSKLTQNRIDPSWLAQLAAIL